MNQPPVLPTAFIYRTYPDSPIQLPVGVSDPEGQPLRCTVDNLPSGASFDDFSGVLSWTPTEQQIGAFYVPFACADDANQSVAGTLTFRVSAPDSCAILTCNPATGCTSTLPPPSEPCCGRGPVARVSEPVAECPAGRVLHIGQNFNIGFGRLQNCDVIRVTSFAQAGAEVAFHAETRCMNTFNRLRLRARLESSAANHTLMFDTESIPYLFTEQDDGFARHRFYRFSVYGPGPFFDIEGAEANLTLTLTDSDGTSVTEQIRVRLTFTPRPDLPDPDGTLTVTGTATMTPTMTLLPSATQSASRTSTYTATPTPADTVTSTSTSTATSARTVTESPTVTGTASATHTPPATPTAMPSSTPTTTDPPSPSPTPTFTPTPTQTSTATGTPTRTPIACVGDCDRDSQVSITELVRGVSIALGYLPYSECTAFDRTADNEIGVFELINAVSNALTGCVPHS